MTTDSNSADLYLSLLKKSLTGQLSPDVLHSVKPGGPRTRALDLLVRKAGFRLAREGFDPALRHAGHDIPAIGESMIGQLRMDHLHACARTVIKEGVPGDFIETGVWRGGASILLRGALEAYGDDERRIFVADSFQGLPRTNVEKYPDDAGLDFFSEMDELAISEEEVRANFAKYDLLDERCVFLKGWFKDTLPALTDQQWSLIRMDGDLYESTTDALTSLYPSLSPGGYLLIDDYSIEACKQAVQDYRAEHDIAEPIEHVDWTGAFWRRAGAS